MLLLPPLRHRLLVRRTPLGDILRYLVVDKAALAPPLFRRADWGRLGVRLADDPDQEKQYTSANQDFLPEQDDDAYDERRKQASQNGYRDSHHSRLGQ
jgi:hypothetical protein